MRSSSPLSVDVAHSTADQKAMRINIRLQDRFAAMLAPTLIETGRWTKNGEMFDVSLWQQIVVNGVKTTSVKWNQLHHPLFHGGYHKFGEAWANYTPQTDQAMAWLDPTAKSNRAAKLKEGLLNLEYIYCDTSWARNRAWTEGGVKALFDGTIDAVANKLIHNVPDLWLLCMMLKNGTGQTFTASQLRSDPDADVDGVVWDVEKHWLNNNQENGDYWTGLCLDTTVKGFEFLATNGYLPLKLAEQQTIYSSEWFLKQYGNVSTRAVLDRYDTIAAGYYFSESDIRNVKNIDELLALLDTFSLAWRGPYNIGASKPGKVVLAYQIAANITMPQITNPMGGASAVDVNSLNISKEALYARYPKYAARRLAYEEGTTPPEPPVDPPPTTVKKYWAVIKPTTTSLKLRSEADAASTMLQNPLKFLAPVEVTLVDPATVPDPDIVWAEAHVFFAVSNKKDTTSVQPYVELTEIK